MLVFRVPTSSLESSGALVGGIGSRDRWSLKSVFCILNWLVMDKVFGDISSVGGLLICTTPRLAQ